MNNLRLFFLCVLVILGCKLDINTEKNIFNKCKFSVYSLQNILCPNLSDCCFESNLLTWKLKGNNLDKNVDIGVYMNICKNIQGLGSNELNIDSIIVFKLNISQNFDRVLVGFSDDISIYKLSEYLTSKISSKNFINKVVLFIHMPNYEIEYDFTIYLSELNKSIQNNENNIKIVNYFNIIDSISVN